jgi:hypothetical protein
VWLDGALSKPIEAALTCPLTNSGRADSLRP